MTAPVTGRPILAGFEASSATRWAPAEWPISTIRFVAAFSPPAWSYTHWTASATPDLPIKVEEGRDARRAVMVEDLEQDQIVIAGADDLLRLHHKGRCGFAVSSRACSPQGSSKIPVSRSGIGPPSRGAKSRWVHP